MFVLASYYYYCYSWYDAVVEAIGEQWVQKSVVPLWSAAPSWAWLSSPVGELSQVQEGVADHTGTYRRSSRYENP